jgi:hypothetical protein
LLRVSGKAEVSANVIAKIKDMVDTNPTLYPLMASNDDAAVLRWNGVGALTSPFIGGVREQDWRQPSISEFFINNLNRWADPRLTANRWSIATYQGGYVGAPSGYAPGEGVDHKSYFLSTTSTTTLMNDPLMGNIMNYSELQFILAEAASKGLDLRFGRGILQGWCTKRHHLLDPNICYPDRYLFSDRRYCVE